MLQALNVLWHKSCPHPGLMKLGVKNRKPLIVSVCLILAIIATALIPGPGSAPADSKGSFYQVADSDFVTPLLGSSLLVNLLNLEAAKFSTFSGYDLFDARAMVSSGVKLLPAARFSGNIFHVAGIKFLLKKASLDSSTEAFISESLWESEFQKSPNVLRASIVIGNTLYSIAGVTKQSAGVFEDVALWIPLEKNSSMSYANCLRVLTRLKIGSQIEEVQDQIAETLALFGRDYLPLSRSRVRVCPVENSFRLKYAPDEIIAQQNKATSVRKS
jgi:hypothetical protein